MKKIASVLMLVGTGIIIAGIALPLTGFLFRFMPLIGVFVAGLGIMLNYSYLEKKKRNSQS